MRSIPALCVLFACFALAPSLALGGEPCRCAESCECAGACPCKNTGAPCKPTCTCVLAKHKAEEVFVGEEWMTHGVSRDHDKDKVKYACRDKVLTRAQALAMIQGSVPDDLNLLRLTIIGDKADRDLVLADLATAPALAKFASGVLVQAYAPADRLIQNLGFVTNGKPVIYLQSADGKVLHRQNEYRGPEKLAEAIRKADPNYDPGKDPDQNQGQPKKADGKAPSPAPSPSLFDWLSGAPLAAKLGALAALVAALMYVLSRKP